MTYRALWITAFLLFAPPAFAQDDGDTAGESAGAAQEGDSSEEADPDEERAKQIYDNGVELYEEGLYEQSIVAFQEAYELSGEPKLLYNVANAQERLGELEASIDTLNTYRVYATDAEKDKLDRRIRSLERRWEEQEEEEAAAAEVAAAAAPPPEPVVTTRPNTAKWVVLGSGAALAVGFGTVSAVTYASGLDARDTGDQASYDSSRTVNNISLPIAGIGAGLALVGIILPSQRQVSLTPNGLGGVTAHVRF